MKIRLGRDHEWKEIWEEVSQVRKAEFSLPDPLDPEYRIEFDAEAVGLHGQVLAFRDTGGKWWTWAAGGLLDLGREGPVSRTTEERFSDWAADALAHPEREYVTYQGAWFAPLPARYRRKREEDEKDQWKLILWDNISNRWLPATEEEVEASPDRLRRRRPRAPEGAVGAFFVLDEDREVVIAWADTEGYILPSGEEAYPYFRDTNVVFRLREGPGEAIQELRGRRREDEE